MKKNEIGLVPHTIPKNLLKMDVNIRTIKPIKILEENTGVSLHDLGLDKAFLGIIPKA